MKFTIVFLLLACVFALALANPGQPWNPGQQRPVTIRPTSFPRPIRVRREALAVENHLAADAIRPPPFLPA